MSNESYPTVDDRLITLLEMQDDDPGWVWVVFIDSGYETAVRVEDIKYTETA